MKGSEYFKRLGLTVLFLIGVMIPVAVVTTYANNNVLPVPVGGIIAILVGVGIFTLIARVICLIWEQPPKD